MKKFMKKTEGFTLVELIVVIAILGILAGVGTVGYSGYIKKANMAADQQLASGVASVLQLEYYSDMDTTGYVILSKGKAPSVEDKTISSKKIADALKTAYGDLGALELKSDEWAISNEMLTAALDAGESVGKSSYVKNTTVGDLLGNVQTIVGAASETLGNYATTPEHMITLLEMSLGETYLEKAAEAGVINKKNDEGKYTLKEGTYTEVDGKVQMKQDLQNQMSNMMVFGVAQDMQRVSNDDMANLMLSGLDNDLIPDTYKDQTALVLASQYAFYKAYAVDCGKEASFNEMNDAIVAAGKSGTAPLTQVRAALDEFVSANADGLANYALVETEDGEAYSAAVTDNAAAIPQIMKGVGAVEGNYNSASSLASGNLYTSGGVAADLTNYINVAGMDDTAKAALRDAITAAGTNAAGGMIISVGPNGVSNPSLS